MSLLSILGLPRARNPVFTGSAPTTHTTNGAVKPRGDAGDSHSADVRADASKMRGVIEARRRQAQAELAQWQKLEPMLEQMSGSATGDQKQEIVAKQAALARKTAAAEREIHEANADLEAIENPGSKREELVSILARNRSGAAIEAGVEIDSSGLDPYEKSLHHDRTVTATSYENGKATIETDRDKQHVGVGGYTSEQSHETEVRSAHLAQRVSDEKKTTVSTTGTVSVESKRAVEVELADGRKSSLVHTDAKELSAKGASVQHSVDTTHLDGSSTSASTRHEMERGEGRVTVKASSSVTETGSAGTARTSERSASGGMIAGKDGIGAQGGLDRGRKITSKGGRQAGLVGGLHASVVCNVGEPSGDPKTYPVTLTVTFGASAGASAGTGKQEGSKRSVGVEVQGSVESSMTVTHLCTEEQLGSYETALRAASKGSKVAATEQEFAIIAAGAKGRWDVARNLRAAMLGNVSAKTAEQVKNVGDSVEIAQKTTGSIGVAAKVGPVGAGVSVSESDEKSKKVTRTDPHTLDVDGKSAHTKETSKSLSMNAGAFDVKVGTVTTHTTSFGYAIEIDDKNDSDHKLLGELGKCETEKQYQAFLARYKGKVKLLSHTVGKKDGKSDETGVGVMGHDVLKFGTGQGTSLEEVRDANGKLVQKTVIGEEHAGGSFLGLKDSKDEQAKAVIDGNGNAEVTLTRTTTANDGAKQLKKRAQKLASKAGIGEADSGKKAGALASVAGGEEDDSATHDVEGLTLTNADLKRIGGVACRSMPAWNGVPRRYQENADWAKAGALIARAKGAPGVVAEQLARFIGGDRVERMKTVEQWVRGGYHASMGHAFEFPDSLQDLQAAYNQVVADSLPEHMDILANQEGNAKATEECKRYAAIADTIEPRLRKCEDFRNEATKAEMLSRLTNRQVLLAEAVKGYGGLGNKARQDPKVLEEQCNRLLKLCSSYYHEQMVLAGELADSDIRSSDDRSDVRKLIKKLEDLQFRWWPDFRLLKDTFARRKMAMPNLPTLMPDERIVAIYEKKIGDA